MTPVLQTPERILQRCETNGFAGCIHYPVNALQKHDSEKGLHFYFELYIYNTAGHFTVVKTETFKLPSRFPPGKATVFDLNPLEKEIRRDIDFHGAIQQTCVYWNGFYHHHNATFYVGIGHKPNRDDVVQFAEVEKNPVCINSRALKSNKKYFASVKAECSGGTSVSSTDGFVIIDDRHIPYTVGVYDGIGCFDNSIPTGKVDTLVKDNEIYGFSIKDLVVGIGHTLFIITNHHALVNVSVISENAVIVSNDFGNSYSISFSPMVANLELLLRHPIAISVVNDTYVRACMEDIDFQTSTFQYSMHWFTDDGLLQRFITHFILTLDHIICTTKSDNCKHQIASHRVHATERSHSWVKLSLPRNSVLKASVQTCFENICLKRNSSNGIRVVQTPRVVSLQAEFSTDSGNCTQITVSVDGVCDAHDTTRTFQWYLAKQRHGHQPLSPVNFIHDQSMTSVKVRLSKY